MILKLTYLFIVFVLCDSQNNGCILKFPVKFDNNQPVLLKNNTNSINLIIPDGGIVKFEANEVLTLACLGIKSTLVQSNANVTNVNCLKDTKFSLGRKTFDFQMFNCTKPGKGTVKVTNQRCGNNIGKTIEIGFPIDRQSWIPLIKVCHDSALGNAIYSEHTLYGTAIANRSKTRTRPSFNSQGITNIPISVVYKRAYQKAIFNNILGSATLAEKFINNSSFVSKGHLSPDSDFLFAPWQFATYFYINVVPQWQVVNAGNWNSLEILLRKFADKTSKQLRVFTGSHDLLTLKDVNNNDVKITLAPGDKVPVPKFIWKIVYDEKNKQAVVFIIINNPFIANISAKEYLCTDVCSVGNWIKPQWSKTPSGFLYCCEYSQFKAVVKTAPNLVVNSLLKY